MAKAANNAKITQYKALQYSTVATDSNFLLPIMINNMKNIINSISIYKTFLLGKVDNS